VRGHEHRPGGLLIALFLDAVAVQPNDALPSPARRPSPSSDSSPPSDSSPHSGYSGPDPPALGASSAGVLKRYSTSSPRSRADRGLSGGRGIQDRPAGKRSVDCKIGRERDTTRRAGIASSDIRYP